MPKGEHAISFGRVDSYQKSMSDYTPSSHTDAFLHSLQYLQWQERWAVNSFLSSMCDFRGQWICQVIFTNGLWEEDSWTWHVESKFDPNMLWLSECQALWKFKALKTASRYQKWQQHQLMPTPAIRKPQMSRDMKGSNFSLPGISVLGDTCHVSLTWIHLEAGHHLLENCISDQSSPGTLSIYLHLQWVPRAPRDGAFTLGEGCRAITSCSHVV